jgi:thiol:disulfide interchange protein
MKRILSLIFAGLLLGAPQMVFPQYSAGPKIDWSFSGTNKGGNEYQLVMHAKIEKGWRLFSITMGDDLPNTRIGLDSSTLAFASILSVKENARLITAKEPLLDSTEVRFFENEAEFLLDLIVKDKKSDIKGSIVFMAYKGDEFSDPETVPFRFGFDANGKLIAKSGGLQESASGAQALKRNSIDLKNPVSNCGGTGIESDQSKGLWGIFALGFLGGLIALLTPCVFPMIPLTVSFFTKRSSNKRKGVGNALLYGFFIFLIYVLLSLPFHFLDSLNPEILNNISTNFWLNLLFFVIFVAFALSFFGLFEITLPGSISNRVDARAGVSGVVGIFFMALTLALVSFSCTGPILGSLLAGSLSSNGGAWQLSSGMAGFGLALALPFALFALFPGWLHSIPKSGGWLTSVKIVLGFVELALAIKFLSNADLVEHWGILKREIFFAIWIICGVCIVLFLFGILKFKNDPPPRKLSKGRILAGLVFLAFTIYLLPGVTKSKYANLSLISGFPPPLAYSIYGKDLIRINGVEAEVVNDYEKALQLAKEKNRPVLIDFTGWACVNCRKMEENVWTDKRVKNLIDSNFVLVSLFVDDRERLKEDQQFVFTTSDGDKKKIRTLGDKYATLQAENFVNVSQPLYVVISPDEKLLTLPVGYTPDRNEYAAWLQCGVEAFRNLK